MLGRPFDNFTTSIKKLKGHLYHESDADESDTYTASIDPYGSNLIPPRFHPLYLIGRMRNGWRVARYRRNIEDLASFSYMLQALEEAKENEGDPKEIERLVKQINYYTNLVNKITTEIHRMEDND
jgi:hypothetical protein